MSKLAVVCFRDSKYTESEKYFKVALKAIESITNNPQSIFNANLNLLALYFHINIDKT